MTALKGLPEICKKCAKLHPSSIHTACELCLDMRFPEEILCDLNRSAQNPSRFECFQFQPALRPVALSVIGIETFPERQMDEAIADNFQALLNSDRLQYQRVLAVQRLQRNPDMVFLDLKYHLVWNVPARKPVFAHPADDINIFQDVFSTCTALVGGFVCVLWLAPDHIHLYVESDGEKSIDAVVRKLKRVSAAALNKNRSKRESQHKADRILWDNVYFVETIG
jgi:REP element-mobilizing transposase RayT